MIDVNEKFMLDHVIVNLMFERGLFHGKYRQFDTAAVIIAFTKGGDDIAANGTER